MAVCGISRWRWLYSFRVVVIGKQIMHRTTSATFQTAQTFKRYVDGRSESRDLRLSRQRPSKNDLETHLGTIAISPLALRVQFTANGMCGKNNTHIYVARTSNNRVISSGDCCLVPQCEALRTCRSGFPIATAPTADARNDTLRCVPSRLIGGWQWHSEASDITLSCIKQAQPRGTFAQRCTAVITLCYVSIAWQCIRDNFRTTLNAFQKYSTNMRVCQNQVTSCRVMISLQTIYAHLFSNNHLTFLYALNVWCILQVIISDPFCKTTEWG